MARSHHTPPSRALTLLRAAVGGGLFLAPLVLARLAPSLGTRRGVWPTMAGVLLGVLAERRLRPHGFSQRLWMARTRWRYTAFAVGVGTGVLASVADGAVRDAPVSVMADQLWIPLYRAVLFAAGLTILRRLWWRLSVPRA